MARTANPYTKVLKHLSKLQDKANKLNAEIAAVTSMVEQQSKQLSTPKVVTVTTKTSTPNPAKPGKAQPAQPKKALKGEAFIAKECSSKKPKATPRQVSGKAPKGRKILTNPDGSPNYLAMPNWDGVSDPPKPRVKKATKPKAPKA